MAAGKPVIASDIDGYRAVLRHGFEGLLVPPESPAALAVASRPLVQRPGPARGDGPVERRRERKATAGPSSRGSCSTSTPKPSNASNRAASCRTRPCRSCRTARDIAGVMGDMTGWRQAIQRRRPARLRSELSSPSPAGVSLLTSSPSPACCSMPGPGPFWRSAGSCPAVSPCSSPAPSTSSMAPWRASPARETRFGAFFDSTLDRYSEALLFCGLLIWFTRTGDWLGALLCYLALLASLMVSYARARAEGLGLECKVGWFQRPGAHGCTRRGPPLAQPRPDSQSDYPRRAFPIHRHPAYDSRVPLDGRPGTGAIGGGPTSPCSPAMTPLPCREGAGG